MVGLLVSSPIFASLGKTYNKPSKLINIGLLIWAIATAFCGVTSSFWKIVVCQMLVGVGEVSFISLTAPFIDDELHEVKITEVSEQGKDVVDVSSGEGQSNNKTSRKTYLSKRTIKHISKRTIKRISRFWKDMFWNDMKVLLLENVYVVSVQVLGTLAGGYLLDRINSSINTGFKLLTATTILGGICCCFAAFCFKRMYGFLACFCCLLFQKKCMVS
ncbi:hypothetical protein MKX03_036064 [Papaver bracteatum]|nr:hypothetical protein MKX03_036064 [Papaver bracteatum]